MTKRRAPTTSRPPEARSPGVAALRLLPVLAALIAVACDRPGDPPRVIRFIDEDPAELFRPEVIASSSHTLDWSFEGDGAEEIFARLRFERGSGSLRPEGLYLSPKNGRVAVALPSPIETRAVDTLVVTLFGLQYGHVEFSWSAAADGSGSRSITRQPRPDGVYSLNLGPHPRWKGEAHQPRLRIVAKQTQDLALKSIVAGRREAVPKKLEAALAQAWKVDLREVRNALLAPPGRRISRRFAIPPGSPAFHFGYGTTGSVGWPVVFRVIAEGPGHGGEEVLWQQELAGRRKRGPGWQTASVDLSPFAGREATLALETTVAGEAPDPVAGLPVWSHPEIVPAAPADGRPNVILISIDTLRADRLAVYGNQRGLTPHLDAWARRHAVVFETAVASAPWTLPSHVSMLTGIDSARHGANLTFATVPGGLATLAEYLRDAGYWTAAITGAAIMNPKYGFYQGHEVYHYRPKRNPHHELEESVELANRWLGEMRQPFFLFFHTYSVHGPYLARQPYYDQLRGGADAPPDPESPAAGRDRAPERRAPRGRKDVQVTRDKYDSGVAHMDAQVHRLLQRIEELGLRGRTLVVFTSDHGEALGEGGRVGHSFIQDHNLLVPLVIELPDGTGAGRIVPQQVRSVDILPTILDALDMTPVHDMDGVSLLPLMRGEEAPELPSVAVSYGALKNRGISLRVENRMKYLYRNTALAGPHGREALYLLESDPLEARNAAADHPETVARLRAEAKRVATRKQGLWMRLSNAGPGSLSGTVTGVGITHVSATSFDVPCPCVDAVREGQLRFEVPAGTSYHLVLEPTGLAELTLEGELSSATAGAFREVLDVRGLTDGAALYHSADGWSLGERTRPPTATGIELWWKGVRSDSEVSPQTDAELRDQLRALGYLD